MIRHGILVKITADVAQTACRPSILTTRGPATHTSFFGWIPSPGIAQFPTRSFPRPFFRPAVTSPFF